MTTTKARAARLAIPDTENTTVRVGTRGVQLTNLDKVFWSELGLTKRDLLPWKVLLHEAHAVTPAGVVGDL